MRNSDRLREKLGWEFYNGYNVSFVPKNMDPAALLEAHRHLWCSSFSLRSSLKRFLRALFTLRWGGMLMCGMMNGFYCLKSLRNNGPISFEGTDYYQAIREAVEPDMHGCCAAAASRE